MSEKMSVVRWMPPLPAAVPNGEVCATVRMKEWVLPTEAVEHIYEDGVKATLLRLANELAIARVLDGNALLAAQDYLRFKAHELEAGRIVTAEVK